MSIGLISALLHRRLWAKSIAWITSFSVLLVNLLTPLSIPARVYAEETGTTEAAKTVPETVDSSPTTSVTSVDENTAPVISPTPEPTPDVTPEVTPPAAQELTPTPLDEATPSPTPAEPIQTPIPSPSPTSTQKPEQAETASDSAIIQSTPTPDETAHVSALPQRSLGKLATLKKGENKPQFVEGEVIVKFRKDKLDVKGLVGKAQAFVFEKQRSLEKKSELSNQNIVVYKSSKRTTDVVNELRKDTNVEYAEPNYIRQPTGISSNDTYTSQLWGLDNSGQTVNGTTGTNDADIDAPEAWNISEGSSQTIVAVIDTGVDYNHPDLAANMWDGTNCKSETGSTLGGCNHGYDFEANDKTPLPDYSTHGTHVAGTIAAVKNNAKGITGISPKTKIMALKVDFSTSNLVSAIDFATQNGAKIINASYGGNQFSQSEYDAINRFRAAGGIFVAAAGNNASNNDGNHFYPSDYVLDNVISVAATDQNDALAYFSNYGQTSVDIGAPGVNIYSSVPDLSNSQTYSENFNTLTSTAIPSGWSKNGVNYWGTYGFSGDYSNGTPIGNVLYGDVAHTPYLPSANSTVTSTAVNLSGADAALMNFYTQCDTEYSSLDTGDWMALEVSGDNFTSSYELLRWNEQYIDNDSDPTGSAGYYFSEVPIPSAYRTSGFKFRLRWYANGNSDTGSIGDGCFVDEITIDKVTRGSTEKYEFKDGTSMAAPHVSGLVALVWGYKPTKTAAEVRTTVLQSGDALPSLSGKTVTGKRINAQKALSVANIAPVVTDVSRTTNEDTQVSIQLSGTDTNGDALIYSVVTPPSHGSLGTVSGNTVTYTPAANYAGSDSFTYKANDGTADSNIGTVTITVNPVNDAPVALAQSVSTPEDTSLPITLTGTDVEGSTLIFSKVADPLHGTLTAITGNSITYTPNANYSGPDSFTFKVNDGTVDSTPATVTITVTAVNDPPILAPIGNKSVNELSTLTFTASATDPDSSVTYSLTGAPVGAAIGSTTGAFTFTPTEAQGPGSYTVNVHATDGTSTDSETITITVNEVNTPPVAQDISVTTAEDTVKSITLQATDTDLPAQTINFALASNPTHGTLDAITNGVVHYTPFANYTGTDSFTYKANDGTADSAPATVSITVSSVNDAPVAVDDALNGTEDTALTIPKTTLLSNDTDAENDTLTVTAVSAAVHGIVTQIGANVIFTPDANYFGNASFHYTVSDGNATDTGTVTIAIAGVNDAPTLNSIGNKNGTEQQLISFTAQGTDVDNDTLTYSLTNAPSGASINATTGEFTWTPTESQGPSSPSITVTVSDGQGGTDSETITITVSEVNTAPTATDISTEVNEDSSIGITLLGSDSDLPANTLTYGLAVAPLHGSLSVSGNTATYIPAANYFGFDSFSYHVNDGTTNSQNATVTITIKPVNDAPVANNQSVTTDEDSHLSVTLSGTDVDGDSLTYEILGQPTHGSLSTLSGNVLTYSPDANYSGNDAFTFTVSDTGAPTSYAGNSVDTLLFGKTKSITQLEPVYTAFATGAIGTVFVTVRSINDAPIAQDDALVGTEDTAISVSTSSLLANDSDVEEDTLSIRGVSNATHGVVTLVGSTVIFTPDANYSGPASFTYELSDGQTTATATVTITISAVNDIPTAASQDVTLEEDSSLPITLTGSDVEGSTLTYSLASPPAHGTVGSITGNTITYTPVADFTGTDSFTFTVNDGTAESAPGTVSITVVPYNDPPVLESIGNKTINEKEVFTFTATATDIDSSNLNFSVTNAPTGAVINAQTGVFQWTPTESQGPGIYSMTVSVSDGAKSDSETFTITVSEINSAPVADDLTVTTSEDTTKSISLHATDSDIPAQAISYRLIRNPQHGSLDAITNGVVHFTPDANFHGADSFTYVAGDGQTESAVATVRITVNPVNDAPIANDDTGTFNEDEPYTVLKSSLLQNDTDIDGDALSLTGVGNATHGTVSIKGTSVEFIPEANYYGSAQFDYTVSDGALTDTGTVHLTITSVNDVPTAPNQSVGTQEDTALLVTLLSHDNDGDSPSFEIMDTPAHGTLSTINGNTVTYTPAENYNGTDTFSYRVHDAVSVSATATVTISISPVNDTPILVSVGDKNIAELSTLTFTVIATDPDNSVTYSLVNAPAGSTMHATTGVFTWTPTEAQGPGTYTFSIRATDGELLDEESITVTVTEVNTPPVTEDISVTTAEDVVANITLHATDSDVPAQTINYALVTNPAHGTLYAIADGVVHYTPDSNYVGSDSFTYLSSDGAVNGNTATVTISVTAVNDAPVAGDDSISTNEDTIVSVLSTSLIGNDSDVENDVLTVQSVGNAEHGTVHFASGVITFDPEPNYYGPASFTYTITDGEYTSTANVSVTVLSVNDAPTANNASVSTGIDSAVTISLSGADIEHDDLSYILAESPLHGTVGPVNGNKVTYTPDSGYTGTDSFTFVVHDGSLSSTEGTVTITVYPPPVISNEAASSTTQMSTIITWTTDHPATSRVIYDTVSHETLGTDANYGYAASTTEDSQKVTTHAVALENLISGTTYYYRVISHGSPETVSDENSFTTKVPPSSGSSSGSGNSNSTNGGSAGTAPVCTEPKPGSAPTLLTIKAGTNSVTLTWKEAADPVTYYLVSYGTTKGHEQYGNPNIGGKGTTSYTIQGLSGGVRYYFRVRAGNGCMPGVYSNELSAVPGGITIETPAEGFIEGVLGSTTDKPALVSPTQTPTPSETDALNQLTWWENLMIFIRSFFSKIGSAFK